ncbi:MAG: O-antigen ligase family protein [Aminipila sp.]
MTKKTVAIPIMMTLFFIIITGAMGAFDAMVQKWVSLACLLGTVTMLFLPRAKRIFKEYTTPLFIAVTTYVVWNGISIFYSDVPKTALFEFTKLIGAFTVFIIVLYFTTPTKKGILTTCGIISFATAFFGVISIDAASNGPIAFAFKGFMSLFTDSMQSFGVFENGIRMTGIFGNANTFAGFMALGVILSLSLVMNSSNKTLRFVSIALLAINSLSYILLFSLGSLFIFFIACIIMIVFSKDTDRLTLFILMVETALITLIFTGVSLITMGTNPILPLVAIILNVTVLYAIDTLVSSALIAKLAMNKKASIFSGIVILLLVICYIFSALNITGALTLSQNETIMRALYLDSGDYKLSSDIENNDSANFEPLVRITTQNKTDLKVHTSTEIYNGALSSASFTVPTDSEIIKIYFTGAGNGNIINSASCVDATTNTEVKEIKLGYKLLPGIVANRIQDLGANQNTIQRMAFFEDGIKLFKQSPILGHGLSGYENGVSSVQNFFYETRYVHNHYIQVLCDLGIIGLVIFISILFLSVWVVLNILKRSKLSNYENAGAFMLPMFAASLVQMFGQAVTDLIWSAGPFLVIAFAILALLILVSSRNFQLVSITAPDATADTNYNHTKSNTHKNILTGDVASRLGILAVTLVMTVLLSTNLYAHYRAASGNCTMDQMAQLTKLDKFEGDDYKTTYIVTTSTYGLTENIVQANKYAAELTNNPNVILDYLLPYYFNTGQDDKLFETASLAAENGKSSPYVWNRLFEIFNTAITPERDNPLPIINHMLDKKEYFIDGILGLYQKLQDRNSSYLDDAMLDNSNITFLSKILGLEVLDNSRMIEILDLFIKTIYTSEFSVDANTDGIPDNIKVLSGTATWGQTKQDNKTRFDGTLSASAGSSIELETYCVRGGNYVLKLSDLKGLNGTVLSKDITALMDGTPLTVQYDDNGAYINLTLKGATAADEKNNIKATKASTEKITISFPSGMQASKLSLRK